MCKYLEMAEETKRLVMEGLEFNAALRKVKEMYKKAQSLTDQDKEKEHNKLFNDSITPKTDLYNEEDL